MSRHNIRQILNIKLMDKIITHKASKAIVVFLQQNLTKFN